jgi:two-component system, cell cycle response regulator
MGDKLWERRGELPSVRIDDDDDAADGDQTALVELDPQSVRMPDSARDRAYFVVIAGASAGEMYRLDRAAVIGRSNDAQIQIDDQGVSRRHARVDVTDGQVRIFDLGSANGTIVNGERISARALCDGDKIQLGSTTILKFTYHDVHDEEFQRNLLEAARRDGLTQAFTRSYLFAQLDREIAFANRHGTPLSLVMIDLDHFKKINDTHGHPMGDRVLRKTSELVQSCIRTEDLFARYGGEEFAVVCRGIDLANVVQFAERLRRRIETTRFADLDHPLTVSVGVAQLGANQDVMEFIATADRRLYAAKRRGRNRVVFLDEP